MCIYKITNTATGKVYIGSTTNYKHRIKSHFRNLENNKHTNNFLQNDWNMYGKEKFKLDIVEIVSDIAYLPQIEKKIIDEYATNTPLYNISNPLDELFIKRGKRKIKYKESKQNNKVIKRGYIIGYLDGKFEGLMVSINKEVNENKFMRVKEINDHIKNSLDPSFLAESDIDNSLKIWYKEHGFVVTNSNSLRIFMKRIFGIEFDFITDEEILLAPEVYSVISAERAKEITSFKVKSQHTKAEIEKRDKVDDLVQTEIKVKYSRLFKRLQDKVIEMSHIPLKSVVDFLHNRTDNDLEYDQIEVNTIAVIRKMNLSVLNLASDFYPKHIIKSFGIETFEKVIVSKELAKEIANSINLYVNKDKNC